MQQLKQQPWSWWRWWRLRRRHEKQKGTVMVNATLSTIKRPAALSMQVSPLRPHLFFSATMRCPKPRKLSLGLLPHLTLYFAVPRLHFVPNRTWRRGRQVLRTFHGHDELGKREQGGWSTTSRAKESLHDGRQGRAGSSHRHGRARTRTSSRLGWDRTAVVLQ